MQPPPALPSRAMGKLPLHASPPLPCLQTSQVGSGQLAQEACSGVEDEQDVKEEEVELSDRGILRIKWGAIRVCARPIWELSGRREGVRMLLLGDMCVSAPPNAHRFCPPKFSATHRFEAGSSSAAAQFRA